LLERLHPVVAAQANQLISVVGPSGVGKSLCCQHLLRDLQGAAEVYPDAHWPTQIADALRETNAVEGGDYERAVRLARAVDATAGTLPPTWEARYLLGLAQAQTEQHQDAEAVVSIVEAVRVAPEWVRAGAVGQRALNRGDDL